MIRIGILFFISFQYSDTVLFLLSFTVRWLCAAPTPNHLYLPLQKMCSANFAWKLKHIKTAGIHWINWLNCSILSFLFFFLYVSLLLFFTRCTFSSQFLCGQAKYVHTHMNEWNVDVVFVLFRFVKFHCNVTDSVWLSTSDTRARNWTLLYR